MVNKPKNRIRSDFNLGGEQAEADDFFLENAFYYSGDYAAVSSKNDSRCFIVARTGGGKSAILKQLERENPDHVVRITPEDLSLPYITDLEVMKHLEALNVNLDPLFIALWKHVFLVELIRHRYKIDSPGAKIRFLDIIRDKIKRDAGKQSALDYLEEFEGRFWCEADERVREITQSFSKKINLEANAGLSDPVEISASGGTASEEGRTVTSQQVDRYQRIVNDTQLARLNKMLAVLDEDILDSPQNFTYVIIDDLDRDWVDEGLANDLIRCLVRSVLDLKRVRNLKVLVALRTNIFDQIDWKKVQQEKLRSLVFQVKWQSSDLVELIDGRVPVASKQAGLSAQNLSDLLPRTNETRGSAADYMISRTLMRPRDILAFLNECFSQDVNSDRLTWDVIKAAEKQYSMRRLLALHDEWKLNYPGLGDFLEKFRGVQNEIDRDILTKRFDEGVLLVAQNQFDGTPWLLEHSRSIWESTVDQSDFVTLYYDLVKLMYNIGFLGVKIPSGKMTFSYESPGLLEGKSIISSVKAFSIHPAFHSALEVKVNSGRR
ncbi:P-loop ATPase, Sll1717 family [Nocardiopsis sp. NPDC101807]|uniref:P-loop ATPase, Sll1717 family n=1 Tax=Nocardiopsis sp. NPDC101807 TaxID=3364339 RepID=UPI00382596E6